MTHNDKAIIEKFMVSHLKVEDLYRSALDAEALRLEQQSTDELREAFEARDDDMGACQGLFKLLVDAFSEHVEDENELPDLLDRLELNPGQMEAFERAVALAGSTPEINQMFSPRIRM